MKEWSLMKLSVPGRRQIVGKPGVVNKVGNASYVISVRQN